MQSEYDYELARMKKEFLTVIEEANIHVAKGRIKLPSDQVRVLRIGEAVSQETYCTTPSPIMKKAFFLGQYVNYVVRGNNLKMYED